MKHIVFATVFLMFGTTFLTAQDMFGAFQIETSPPGASIVLSETEQFLCTSPSPSFPVFLDQDVEYLDGIPGREISLVILKKGFIPLKKAIFVPILHINQYEAIINPTIFSFRLNRDYASMYLRLTRRYCSNTYNDYYYPANPRHNGNNHHNPWNPPGDGNHYNPPNPPGGGQGGGHGGHGHGGNGTPPNPPGGGTNPPNPPGGGNGGGGHGGHGHDGNGTPPNPPGGGTNPPNPPGGGTNPPNNPGNNLQPSKPSNDTDKETISTPGGLIEKEKKRPRL